MSPTIALHERSERVERRAPEDPVPIEPRLRLAERTRADRALVHAPIDRPHHEARALEDANVLRHGGKRHRKRLREIADARRPAREPREDGASRAIRERVEDV